MMEQVLQDVKYAVRGTARSPGFTFVAVVSIAVGIAATATITSLANALFFRPLPVQRAGELLHVYGTLRGAGHFNVSYPEYRDLSGLHRVFATSAAFGMAEYGLRRPGQDPVRVHGETVSGNYFSTLGLAAQRGRLLQASDDDPAAPSVIVISDALWRHRFDAADATIGATVALNGHPVTIVGVAPTSYTGMFTGLALDLWTCASSRRYLSPSAPTLTDRASRTFEVVVRRRVGVTEQKARLELATLGKQLQAAYPADEQERGFVATPATGVRPEIRRAATVFVSLLLAAAILVLVTASANVAGLLLVRATIRRREVAIRLAVGASQPRLIRLFLIESLLLAAAGGLSGLLLTLGTTRLLGAFRPDDALPISFNLRPDIRVLLVTVLVTAVTGIACGLAPALQSTKPDVVTDLKEGSWAGGGRPSRLRNLLVTAQIALTIALLAAAGVLVNSLRHSLLSEPGFDVPHLSIVTADPEVLDYDPRRTRAFYDALLRDAIMHPGVEDAALGAFIPLASIADAKPVSARGPTSDPAHPAPSVLYNVISTGYFGTLGAPVVAGRDFSAADDSMAPRVIVINQSAARQYWRGLNPIGRTLWIFEEDGDIAGKAGGQPARVVGVVRDAKYRSYSDVIPPYIFFPFSQRYSPVMTLHLRTHGDPGRLAAAVRERVRSIDPDVPVTEAGPIADAMRFVLTPQRLGGALLSAAAALALGLSAIGVYGIIAFSVAQRAPEIAVRMALGARASSVGRLVMWQGMRLTLVGVVIGTGIGWLIIRALSGVLYGVKPGDVVPLLGAAAVILVTAIAASIIPALRAMGTSLMLVLRA